jgi:hypothetical protein
MKLVTSCQIETPRGDATFGIVAGDIAWSTAPVIVVSAAAHDEWPVGAAIEAIENRFGGEVIKGLRRFVAFSEHDRFSLGPNRFETFARYAGVWTGPLGGEGRWLVVARLPGARHLASPETAFEVALDAVFATLGGLSTLERRRFDHIAISDLGGTRGYLIERRLAAMTTRLSRWFASPAGGERAELVLYDDGGPSFAEQSSCWQEAMRQQQGWAVPGPTAQAAALLAEVRAIAVDRAQAEPPGSAMHHVLLELGRRMDPAQRRSVQEIAQVGRQLAEVISAELCADHGIEPSHNTFANLDRLEKAPNRVARWILSYLHTLRTLGNEASHAVQQGVDRFPRTIIDDDLVVLAAHVRRVIDFRTQWARRGGPPT